MSSMANTLILGVVASVLATLLGIIAALGVFSLKNKLAKSSLEH